MLTKEVLKGRSWNPWSCGQSVKAQTVLLKPSHYKSSQLNNRMQGKEKTFCEWLYTSLVVKVLLSWGQLFTFFVVMLFFFIWQCYQRPTAVVMALTLKNHISMKKPCSVHMTVALLTAFSTYFQSCSPSSTDTSWFSLCMFESLRWTRTVISPASVLQDLPCGPPPLPGCLSQEGSHWPG